MSPITRYAAHLESSYTIWGHTTTANVTGLGLYYAKSRPDRRGCCDTPILRARMFHPRPKQIDQLTVHCFAIMTGAQIMSNLCRSDPECLSP